MKRVMRIGRVTIAVILLLALAVMWVSIILPVRAEPLDSYHSAWKLIRETANEDSDTFALTYNLTTAGNFDNKDSSTVANGGPYHIRSYYGGEGREFISPGGAWIFTICGENFNATDDTFSFHILGWSKINGMLQVIAEGDGVLGDQAVIAYPDDNADALGATSTGTDVGYTASSHTYLSTTGEFDGTVVNMMAYVTSADEGKLTSGFYEVTTYTDVNTIVMSGDGGSSDTTATVQINPAFWADVINLDETTKWPSIAVYNSEASSGQVAFIKIDTTGLEWVQFVIYKAAGSGDEAGNITVYGRPY